MCVVVDIFRQQLLNVFFLIQNYLVLFYQHLGKVGLMYFQFGESLQVGVTVNLDFGDHLLEIF